MSSKGRGGGGRSGMSRRGNFNCFHRGNANGNGPNRNNRTTGVGSNNTIIKFFLHAANSQQSVTYEVVKDAILDRIQREYKDGVEVVQSLRDLKLIDMDMNKPVRLLSSKDKEQKILNRKLSIWNMLPKLKSTLRK